MSYELLKQRIKDRSARVGILGLGYVGLPLLRAFHFAGFTTIGFDIDEAKIVQLKTGRCYLKHLGEDFIADMNRSGRFDATSDFARLGDADVVIICVPTPLGAHMEPDLTFVERTAQAIARSLRPGQLVVLESTTYPGTTREVVLPILEATGLVCGRDFFTAFSPEREDPGRKTHHTQNIPKLVGGVDAQSGELAVLLYQAAIEQVVPVSSAEVAEAAKLLENIYRCINIAMVNEMKVVLDKLGIDIWEVIEAAATKPFGFQAFYPGPGLGGHCIPIDPFYLTWKAREVGQPTRFIELAGEVNHHMPDYVVSRVLLALNQNGKAIKGSRGLLLGLAYKPDIDDIRESPSIELIEKLLALEAHVDFNDPHIASTHPMRRHQLKLASVPLSAKMLHGYDCVLIATHHSAYDWHFIGQHARLIVDTRGVMRKVAGVKARVVSA